MVEPTQNKNFPCHKTNTFRLQVIKPYFLQSNNFPFIKISGAVNITVSTLTDLENESTKNKDYQTYDIDGNILAYKQTVSKHIKLFMKKTPG